MKTSLAGLVPGHGRALFAAASALALLVPPSAQAHNLDADAVYAYFDPDTRSFLDARIAGGWVAGTPLLQNGDEIGVILKAIPNNGTNTGVGGYITFYLPDGAQLLDAAYVQPGSDPADGLAGYDKIPMKGQALMPNVGAGGGPTVSLVGLSRGPNIAGVTANLVNNFNVNNGTLPAVYGDLGIFYSTAPETAYGTYSGGTLKNNSGDTVGLRTHLGVPLNRWDTWQLAGYGIAGTTNPTYPTSPLLDSNGRGNTGWGLANAVAGPQSGYAWEFDLPAYAACDPIPYAPTTGCLDAATSSVGPWNRIRYPGSQIASDVPGDLTAGYFNGGLDASNIGYDLSAAPLPATTGQANGSPNAVRWAVGQLTLYTPEYVWVKLRINDYSAILDPSGCPNFYLDTFGGDAGGDDNGKDHIWRYYDPNSVLWNGCLAVGKPATREAVQVGETFQYNVTVYNTGTVTLSNVTITDTLPSGVTFVSAAPAQSSGPNPLVWNIGTLAPGQKFSSVVTVKASGSGMLVNSVTVTGQPPTGPPISSTADELTPSGTRTPILKQSKDVFPTTVVAPGTVQYTIRVDNIGNASTGNPVKLTENLPAGFTYQSLASAVVNGATVTGVVTVNATNPAKPVFTIPAAIQPTKSLVLVFNASVAANTPSGTFCNSYVTNQNSTNVSTGTIACVNVGGGTIGDTVFRDWDGDGIQDAGDEGLSGVAVNLYAGACPPAGAPIDTETTNATGFYEFTGLAAGTYCVDAPTVGSGGVPSGYSLTTGNDPTQVTLADLEVRSNVDFGYQPGGTGSIGDKVFDDRNTDGVFNGTDAGIPSVTVYLYEDTNGNGVIDAGTDLLIATTTTNGSGNYLFSGLATGVSYIVDVDQNDPDIAAYYTATYGDASGVGSTTGDPLGVASLAGAYTNADFGFYRLIPGSIGNDVFLDLDKDGIRDPGESGLSNVTVYLYQDTDGNGMIDPGEPLLATTTTDANGNYLFAGLPPGTYVAQVDATDPDIPAEYAASVNPIAVTLAEGQNRIDVDFPFVAVLTKTVDKTYDNPAVAPNLLTYTITPRYPGFNILSSVIVTDAVPTGSTFVNNVPISPNAGGIPVDNSDPVDGIIDAVEWNLGANTVRVRGFTGGGAPPACQTTVTVDASADTWIDATSVATNHGTDTGIRTRNGATYRVGLLRFPVAPGLIPAGAVYNGATLQLTPSSGSGTNRQIQVRQLLTGFTEGSQGNAACTVGAAWQGPNCTDDWLSAGGNFGTSDYSATNLGTFDPLSNNTTISVTNAALNTVVSGWLTGGVNRGLSMIPVGAGTNEVVWYTRTAATATQRPRLVISYTPNGCTGQTIIRDTGANEVPDSYIQEDSGGNDNFGTDSTFRTRFEATRNRHGLVKFNTSLIPAGVTIESATFQATVTGSQANATVAVHRMLTPWVEGTSATNGVQWNDPNGTGVAGTWAAGTFSASDYDATVLGSLSAGSSGAKTLGVTSLVQSWYSGALVNEGLLLRATAINKDVQWASSENGTITNRPALVVDWSIDPSAPAGVNTITAAWSVAQVGDAIPVTMRLTNNDVSNYTGVSPSTLTVTGTNGAAATCTGPAPASSTIPAGGYADFSWTCTVTAIGSSPGLLKFSATATNGTNTWSTATSNGVIVSPVLQFQVNVNNPAGVTVVDNTAEMLDGATLLSASNTVRTSLTSSIGDFVWNDVDADGIQDAGEIGIPGVRVFLDADGDGQYDVGETFAFTDSSGAYLFTGLVNGTYSVVMDQSTLPAGYFSTTPSALSRTITLSGQQITNADFGATLAAGPTGGSIGDTVWLDSNEDGVVDPGEPGLPGVTIELWNDANGNGVLDAGDFVVGTTTTDANGNYLFDGVPPGDYLVVVDTTSSVTTPFGVSTTIGAAMDLVSGVNPTPVTLAAGEDFAGGDFGYNWGGSIGDFAWYDKDGDGVQDGPLVGCDDTDPLQECPAPNMTAVLYYDVNGDGIIDMGDPIIGVAVTDASGYYVFPNLPPGNYLVESSEQEVPAPASSPNAGQISLMVHTGSSSYAVALAPNQDYLTADFGFLEAAELEGHLFHDADRNGVFDAGETPLAGVTVYLEGVDVSGNPVSLTTVTNADGEYVFLVPPGDYTISYEPSSPPIPSNLGDTTTPVTINVTAQAGQELANLDFGLDDTGRIGDRVWVDADGDGVQDAGESGLAGVTVVLWLDPNGDGNLADAIAIDAQATDALGGYLFAGLPDNVGVERYVVQVLAGTLPAGLVQTADPDQAGTCITCDSQSVTLLAGGASILTKDFGYNAPVSRSLSGTIFVDDGTGGGTALNGVQDGTEAGVGAGVTVTAEIDTDNNGVVDFMMTTTTDSSGNYTFAGIPDGSRVVVTVGEGTLPSASFARTNDVDGGADATITIASLTSNVADRDFGYVSTPGSISGTVCSGSGDGLCNDPGETPGIPGVTITLVYAGPDGILGTADDTTATVATDANGNYLFDGTTIAAGNCSPLPCALDDGLPPGLYQVLRGTSAGYTGLADADGGTPAIITVALGLDEDRIAQDFELEPTGVTDLRIDKTGPASIVAGQTVVYTITVTNDGPGDAADVTVTDATPTGLTFVSNTGDCTTPFPCLLGTVPTGATRTITATYAVPSSYAGPDPIVNSASVSTSSTDTDPANDTDSHSAPVSRQADLRIQKDDGTAVYVAGGSLTYTITVSNVGPSRATGALVEDVFPPQLTGVTWTCSGTNGGVCTASGSGDISDLVTVPVGGSVTYLVSVDVPPGTTVDPLVNTATVTPPAGTTDPVLANNSDDDQDSPTPAPAALGDRVWLDEDGDGVQDAGEDGLAGVTVRLYDATGTVLVASTTTDTDGRYLFANLAAGAYVVRIDTASLPAGLAANPTYDLDDGTTAPDAETAITAVAGALVETGDFGFNWVAPSTSANPAPSATGAIGDRIWNDADQDGIQDFGEAGIEGVTVRLLTDDDGDGTYGGAGDNPPLVTTTDANGNYVFDDLPAGAYVIEVDTTTLPAGYSPSPTGDPDGDGDSSTTPIVLAPGDVYLGGDFGYPLPSGHDIGSTIFLDANADGIQGAGEPGVAGVTVTLLDSNGDVIASTTTDASGQYLFPGLPDGTYTVVVSDTASVLADLPANTADPDGGFDRIATVTLAGADELTQDFGFAPAGQEPGEGLIGDTIFLDRDFDGIADPGEGLEGVVVGLYDATGTTLIATVVTDVTGQYVFGGLDPTETYVVRVDSTTLPNSGLGLLNTVDPDGGSAHEALVDLTTFVGGITLDQDFGYEASAPNSIGGTIFADTNADGTLGAGETAGFEGITVILIDDNGNVVGTTTTDAAGNYQFDGLPDGTYTVEVSEAGNVLGGLASSEGPSPGSDGNSQPAGYSVTVVGGVTDTTADFGYYEPGAAIGNLVFEDLDNDGIQDPGENGIAGVPVTLTITYPNGDVTTVVTVTDASGAYAFPNLLLDETFDGTGAGEPTYVVSVGTPPGYQPSPVAQGGDPQLDSNDPSGTTVTPVQGTTDTVNDALATNGYDFGFTPVTDVSITKSGPGGVTPGFNIVYTLVVTNEGLSAAENVVVADTTPTGLTFVSNSSSPAGLCSGAFPCNLGTLAPGASVTITSTYAVPVAYAGPDPIVNVASVSTSSIDTNAANDSDDASTSVTALQADLAIVKSGPASATSGQNVTFTLDVTNNGPDAAANVIVSDPAPAGLTFVSATAPCAGGFPCNLGTVASGGAVSISVTFAVPASYSSPNPITNLAAVTSDANDPVPGNNSDDAQVPVAVQADVSVVKTGPATVVPGSNVTYTIVVANAGPSNAANVTITDPAPAGLTFVSATPCGASLVTGCGLGTLVAGGSVVITATYAVPVAYAGANPIVNTATAASTTPDPNPGNESDDASTAVLPTADLAVVKSDPGTGTSRGAQFTYTVLVTNNGPAAATAVNVTDTLDADTTYVSDTGGCTQVLAGVLSCPVGNLAVGASTTFTITVQVDPTAQTLTVREDGPCNGSEDLCNTVSVSGTEADPVPSNNSDTEPTNVIAADLMIVKSDSGDGVNRLEDFAYTITVTNNGTVDATDVVVVDTLDPDTEYVDDDFGCTEGPVGTLTCPVGAMAPGEVVTFHVVVKVLATAPSNGSRESGGCTGSEDLCNSVSVTSAQGDANPNNNVDDEPTNVTANRDTADLSITKTDLTGPVQAGAFSTYLVAVTNSGPDPALEVRVVDLLDPWMTYVGGSLPCSQDITGLLVCDLGTLASGATAEFEVIVQIDPSAPTGSSVTGPACPGGEDACNRVSVSSPTNDPDPTDNQAEVATDVVTTTSVASLSLTKTDVAAEPVLPGNDVTYRIVVSNAGPGAADNVYVHETLDESMTYVSDSAGCSVTTANVSTRETLRCPLGTIAAGASAELFVRVTVTTDARVDSTMQDGDCDGFEDLCNSALVTSDAADFNVLDNVDSEPTDVSLSPTCNDGVVDVNEQCDPPSGEVCNNGVDDDGDVAIDCSDPDCQGAGVQSCDGNCELTPACVPILNDPAKLSWNRVYVHGKMIGTTPMDPLLEGFRFVVSNEFGVIYSGELKPGDMSVRTGARTSRWRWKDKAARKGRGLRDGIFRVGVHERIEKTGEISYVFSIIAYGDMSGATVPRITTHAYIGNDVSWLEADWSGKPGAWLLRLKDAMNAAGQ